MDTSACGCINFDSGSSGDSQPLATNSVWDQPTIARGEPFCSRGKAGLTELFFYRQYPIFAYYSTETEAVAREARKLPATLIVWAGKHDVYTEVGVRLPAARIIPQNKFPQQPWLQLRLLHEQGKGLMDRSGLTGAQRVVCVQRTSNRG